ncbi:MAG: N-acetylmuramoyl-L-alanine amidase [Bacteroidota bacterium]
MLGMKKVRSHQLESLIFRELPFRDSLINPLYITIHYSATSTLKKAWQALKDRGLSYHLLVDQNGELLQCVPLNKRAAHAGYSNWKGLNNLNDFSIGICAVNLGYLQRFSNGLYGEVNAHNDPTKPFYEADELYIGRHPYEGRTRGWLPYPEAQIQAIRSVCESLIAEYPTIRDIVGHDEIAISRKVDPGPAFPLGALYDLVPDRESDRGQLHRVSVRGGHLNIRRSPNSRSKILGTFPHGQEVRVRSYSYRYRKGQRRPVKTLWAFITTRVDGLHEGFVYSRFLKKIS